VDLLARYGRRELGDDLLGLARYVETAAGDFEQVRGNCLRLLEPFREGAMEAAALAVSGPGALREAAAAMARARGGNALLPREVRMSLEQRTQAHEYMLRKLLDVEIDAELETAGQEQLARGLGLRSGHGGKNRDIRHALADDELWHLDLEMLVRAVVDASPAVAELARRSVAIQHLWMPAMMNSLWEDVAPGDAPLLRVADGIAAHQSPKMYPLAYAAALVRKQSALSPEAIEESAARPDEALTVAAAVLDAPGADRALARIGVRLRPYPRLQLRMAVAELLATRGTRANETRPTARPPLRRS
jgi:hypothetical protein